MKIIRFLLISLIFLTSSITATAQSFVSISTGILTDVNQNRKSFYHIPVSIQWKPFAESNVPFLLQFDYGIPLTAKDAGDAFTLNPSLPAKVTLTEKIQPYIFTFSIGFQIHLLTTKKNNSFYLDLFPLGISNQNFKINYKNYDKENYEVLNPDLNRNSGGYVMSMAAVYNLHNDLLLMLHLQTPTFTRKDDYLFAFKSIAPLQLTFGYKFYYKKRK
jgi:hypothetical protein